MQQAAVKDLESTHLADRTTIRAQMALERALVLKERGRIDESIRELHHKPYRIVYMIQENQDRIDILRYGHASRGFLTLKP